jgi:hypothetical protein
VLYITGSISPTVEGLRITGGDALGLGGFATDSGGAIYIIDATATIDSNRIISSSAGYGGGILLYQSHSTLVGNTVYEGVE